MRVDEYGVAAGLKQLVPQIQQQPAGDGGHVVNPAHVQHDDVELVGSQ